MTFVPLPFGTFRNYATSDKFKGEQNVHPVVYYDDGAEIIFYKFVGSIVYFTVLVKEGLPDDINIETIKGEFNANDIPAPINQGTQVNLTGIIS